MKLKTGQKILIAVLVAAVFIYILVTFLNTNFTMVHTQSAAMASVTDTIDTEGYIIRNETYITNDIGGVVSYTNSDGGSVAAKGVIANVYSNDSDATSSQRIQSITQELERLQKLNSTKQLQGTSLVAINAALNNNISGLIKDVKNNNMYNLSSSRDELLYTINERQIVTGTVLNFDAQIAQLQSEKAALEAKTGAAVGTITSPSAGYYIDYTDGYENVYDYNKVPNMTYEELQNVKEKQAQDVSKNVIGKIIDSVNWYICCPISSEDIDKFTDIDSVNVIMPFATTSSVPVDVVAVNKDSKSGNAVAVLKCKYNSDQLLSLRDETVKIQVVTYTGIKIPQSAIHNDTVTKTIYNDDGTTTTDTKEVQGVYVLHGNELQFKEIDKIYSTDDFAICSQEPADGVLFNGETVALYDEIVTEGADLYAGKIVKQMS